MLTLNDAYYDLAKALRSLYDEQEATAMAHMALEHITGMDKLSRIIHKADVLDSEQSMHYHHLKEKLLQGTPLQYVLGQAWFMGRSFKVNEYVLIPRPETEELVQWIIDEHKDKQNLNILDVGTGSGCIPISLKLALPQASVTSIDISPEAISVAKENAASLNAPVNFQQLDFLNTALHTLLEQYDIIVSNPPYIPSSEHATMHSNVKDFEPSIALFVPDNDPLVFYKTIAQFGLKHLKSNGSIYCEIHRDFSEATCNVFSHAGYSYVIPRKDLHGNDRMTKAMQ